MPEPPTPGEIAHAVYWLDFAGRPPTLAWNEISTENRHAWEAAAQAAIAQWWRDHEAVICGEEERDDG